MEKEIANLVQTGQQAIVEEERNNLECALTIYQSGLDKIKDVYCSYKVLDYPSEFQIIDILRSNFSKNIDIVSSKLAIKEEYDKEKSLEKKRDIFDDFKLDAFTNVFQNEQKTLVQSGNPRFFLSEQKFKSIQDILNILEFFQSQQFMIDLMLECLTTGSNITKQIFICESIWKIQLTDVDDKLIDMKINSFKEINNSCQKFLKSKFDLEKEIIAAFKEFIKSLLNLYGKYRDGFNETSQKAVEEPQQNNLFAQFYQKVVQTKLQQVYSNFSDSYISNPEQQFYRESLELFRNLKQIFTQYNDFSQILYSLKTLEFEQKFLALFIRDFVCQNVISNAQLKFIQYQINIKNDLKSD